MSSYWCYRCSSFVTVSAAAGDAVLVCPDCGQQRWSSTVVEYNVGENLQAVETLPTIEVNYELPAEETLPTMDVCAVCIEELNAGAELQETPCKHTYHSHCIRKWLAQHNSCPICRHQLRRDAPLVGMEGPVVYRMMDNQRRRRRRGRMGRFAGRFFSCCTCISSSLGAVEW